MLMLSTRGFGLTLEKEMERCHEVTARWSRDTCWHALGALSQIPTKKEKSIIEIKFSIWRSRIAKKRAHSLYCQGEYAKNSQISSWTCNKLFSNNLSPYSLFVNQMWKVDCWMGDYEGRKTLEQLKGFRGKQVCKCLPRFPQCGRLFLSCHPTRTDLNGQLNAFNL